MYFDISIQKEINKSQIEVKLRRNKFCFKVIHYFYASST